MAPPPSSSNNCNQPQIKEGFFVFCLRFAAPPSVPCTFYHYSLCQELERYLRFVPNPSFKSAPVICTIHRTKVCRSAAIFYDYLPSIYLFAEMHFAHRISLHQTLPRSLALSVFPLLLRQWLAVVVVIAVEGTAQEKTLRHLQKHTEQQKMQCLCTFRDHQNFDGCIHHCTDSKYSLTLSSSSSSCGCGTTTK